MQTREDSDGIHSFVRICIDPSGPLRFTFRKSKKNYSRCNCEPIYTIYYAEAHRHSLHEPFSLAVNLVRNIKPRRVFANHRNKQPLVTSAWRHGKHRYWKILWSALSVFGHMFILWCYLKKCIFNCDAELQINKTTMVQSFHRCHADIWSGILAEVFICVK